MTLALIKYDYVNENGYGELEKITALKGVIVACDWENGSDFKRRCDRYCKDHSPPGFGTCYYWEDITEL